MQTLSSNDAITAVRRNIDELDKNGSAMYGTGTDTNDNDSLDNTIRRFIPDAVNAIHLAAPVAMLEGVDFSFDANSVGAIDTTDGILSFMLNNTSGVETKFLRLVFFQATKATPTDQWAPEDAIVTVVTPESGAEARKQLNPYLRGRYDRPVLVKVQQVGAEGAANAPMFRYYTVRDLGRFDGENVREWEDAIAHFNYIKELSYVAPTVEVPNPTYDISEPLRQNIIDYLTGLVLETFSDQRAQFFFTKASTFNNA